MSTVLFLSKKNDPRCELALALLREHFPGVTAAMGEWGTPFPAHLLDWSGEFIISYLSRWVVPAPLLARAAGAAINFHPGPPEYPGFGCYNFALYENAAAYGVTCHHMQQRVDSGAIVAVRRFPIQPCGDVASLLEKTHDALLALFSEIISTIVRNDPLPVSSETWTRPPFRKTQLEELHRITPGMTREEIARRTRAVTMGKWRPFIELHGHRFIHD